MLRFGSDRERRLWSWTLVVVIALYSTLGLARTLSGFLRQHDLLGVAFGFAMLLVTAAVLLQALRHRPGSAEVAVGLGVAATYLLLFVRMATPEERTHLIEYSVIGILVYEALLERARHLPSRWPTAPLAIGITGLLGVIDEGIQHFLPQRVFDPVDMLFNLLAGSLAVGTSWGLARLRARRQRTKP